MADILTTKIDDRLRPGALTGLVHPGQRYQVERIAEGELRFRLLVPMERPTPWLEKRDGLLVLIGGGPLTQAQVDKELENFP